MNAHLGDCQYPPRPGAPAGRSVAARPGQMPRPRGHWRRDKGRVICVADAQAHDRGRALAHWLRISLLKRKVPPSRRSSRVAFGRCACGGRSALHHLRCASGEVPLHPGRLRRSHDTSHSRLATVRERSRSRMAREATVVRTIRITCPERAPTVFRRGVRGKNRTRGFRVACSLQAGNSNDHELGAA